MRDEDAQAASRRLRGPLKRRKGRGQCAQSKAPEAMARGGKPWETKNGNPTIETRRNPVLGAEGKDKNTKRAYDRTQRRQGQVANRKTSMREHVGEHKGETQIVRSKRRFERFRWRVCDLGSFRGDGTGNETLVVRFGSPQKTQPRMRCSGRAAQSSGEEGGEKHPTIVAEDGNTARAEREPGKKKRKKKNGEGGGGRRGESALPLWRGGECAGREQGHAGQKRGWR